MTNNNVKNQPPEDDFVDITPYIFALWQRKKTGLALTFILLLTGYAISFTRPVMFTAEMVVAYAPTRDADASTAGAGRLGALGALGSTFGLGGMGGKLQEDLATLRSNQFAGKFIESNHLAKELVTGSWSIFTQTMKTDPMLYDEASKEFTQKGNSLLERNAHLRAFSALIDITEDKRSTLVTINLSWWQRAKAQQLLSAYIESLNRHLRDIEISEAERNIDYLMQQINATDIVELKKTFFGLIETQQKKIMLAQTRPDYAFKIIDPPLKPYKKSQPSRLMFAAAGGALGMALFFCWTIFTVLRTEKSTHTG